MGLWKLRLSMAGTLALIIGVSTLFFAFILNYLGTFSLSSLFILVLMFNLAQWMFAPYIIEAIYRVKELPRERFPELHEMVDRLSERSGIKRPKLMVSNVPIPNAFAYGSPLTGNRIAITRGLLDTLELDEVEAVIGHEIGHLKHRDVQIMMFVSLLPALFYYLSQSLYYSAFFGGYGRRDEGGVGVAFLIAMVSMVAYFILNLLVLGLSRLREYYADAHSVSVVEDGPRKLSVALAKIVTWTGKMKATGGISAGSSSFKTLFICDPDRAVEDAAQISRLGLTGSDARLVEKILRRRLTFADRLIELFSTHPNIVKRLRALQSFGRT